MYQQHNYLLLDQLATTLPLDTAHQSVLLRQMHIEMVCRKEPLRLQFANVTHYLLPLSNNLMLLRGRETRFGMHLPAGLLWPTAGELELHCQYKGQVAIVEGAAMRELMALSAETRVTLLQAIGRSWQHVNCEFEQYACGSLTSRVARLLLVLDATSHNGCIHYAHTELAALLNAQRESISVIIGRFRRQGWVTTSYSRIQLSNPQALHQLTEAY